MIHNEKSPLAGKKISLKDGTKITIEDWWDRLVNKSWMDMTGNPACLKYAIRSGSFGLPLDNEVLYGHRENGLGDLFHITEIEA